MRLASLMTIAALALTPAATVQAAGLEAGKICQVIRSCNFARNAEVRGCLSSYSCRQCQMVRKGTVVVNGIRRSEWRSVCDWGAGS
jgi:hypothetical protein